MTEPADRPWNQPQRTPDQPPRSQFSTWSTPQKITMLVGGVIVLVVAVMNLQLVLELVVVTGVVVLLVRRTRSRAAEQQRQAAIYSARAREIASYHQMSPRQFEEAIGYLCQRDGCTSVQVVGKAGDLGADVIAITPDGRRLVIQCKRYTLGNQVSGPDLQKFGGTCYAVHQAGVAAVVTTSGFTKQARQYAGHMRIGLWGNDALAGWASRTGPAPWH